MTSIPVCGPILAVLSEFDSSDDVLNALLAIGFSGLELSQENSYSHLTRRRAYIRLADKKFSTYSEEEQWRVAVALAKTLLGDLKERRRERLPDILEKAGWRFDGESFVKIGEPAQARPAFFAAGETHDAYVHIRSILQTAKTDLLIIDPWAGGRIYALIATVKGLTHCRILCGPKPQPDVVQEPEAFVKQCPAVSLKIRASKEFHDRFAFVDGSDVFLFGASVEHAGARAFSMIPIGGADLAKFILEYAEKVWAGANALFPKPLPTRDPPAAGPT